VLQGLESVAWQSLQHAYGAAEDVPALIRALAGPEGGRQEALSELYANIWHQGTVYEASAHAVPFLVELAAQPELEGRGEILGLIAALADGRSYLAVHATDDPFGRAVRAQPDFEERLSRELGHVARVGQATRAHREVFRRLLVDGQPMVRAAAFQVLSRPAVADQETVPVALEAARRESDRLARAAMLSALGSFGDKGRPVVDLLEAEVQEARDHRIRFGAALSLCQLLGSCPACAQEVCGAMAAAPWFAESFLSGVPWDFSAALSIESSLEDVTPDLEGAIDMLVEQLRDPELSADVAAAIVHDLLEASFPQGAWRSARPPLTDRQYEVLACVARTERAWADARGLWFLLPEGSPNVGETTATDLRPVRERMLNVLRSSRPSG
jgi:hypothetical protein